ncbi:hypothetical protein BJH93_03995 [Kocuria polaris]|nr:hypothetical protein [Kocuria polaris]
MNTPRNRSLRNLLEDAVARHDASIRQLTRMAQGEGYKVNHTTLGQLRSGSYKYGVPSEETIRAIAWLAGVPVEVAFTAAGQPVPGPPLGEELPPGSDYLSPKSRKLVVDMVRVLVDLEGHNRDASTKQAAADHADVESAAGGDASGEEQKTNDDFVWPADQFDLAAHPPMELNVERFDRLHGDAGEESQEQPEQD